MLARKPPEADIKVLAPPVAKAPLIRHTPTDVDFSDDATFVQHQLETYADKHGMDALERFDSGSWMPAPDNPLAPPEQQAKVEDGYIDKVRGVVRERIADLRARVSTFVDQFELMAHTTLMTMLTDSEIRVKSELERLGIKSEEHMWGLWSSHSGAENAAGKKLATDAKALLAKFDEVKANETLPHFVDQPPLWGDERKPADEERRLKAKGEFQVASDRLERLKNEYNVMRHDFETANPVAIGYELNLGGAGTRQHLVELADENAAHRADKLGSDLKDKLENIAKVRKYAQDFKYVWRLEKVADVTLERPEVKNYEKLKSDGVRRSAIYDKVGAYKAADELTSAGMGVVMFALGLIAAAPTGGLSMAGSAAVTAAGGADVVLSVATAVTSAQRYEMEKAESGTDYDKAKVVADRDPSLLWLALDLIGAVAGVAKAREIFGQLKALRDEALSAKAMMRAEQGAQAASKEFDAAMERLRAAGNEAAPETRAGDRLKREVESASARRTSDPDADGGPATEREPATARGSDLVHDAAEADAAKLAGVLETINPMKQEEAFAAYATAFKENPYVEHGVIHHIYAQDAYYYIKGKAHEVVPPAFLKNFTFERHFHPLGAKFPSVGVEELAKGKTIAADADALTRNLTETTVTKSGDFAAAKQTALKTGEPVTETIDWFEKGEERTTRYGFDPRHEEPFWFEVPGTELKGRYKSLWWAEYEIRKLMKEHGLDRVPEPAP